MSSRGRRYTKPILDGLLSDDEEDGVARRPPKVTATGQPASKRGRPSQKCRMVDITALLGMPQRQAAEALGISESMLCKRFKECTKRKWPFRYLGKLDKKIAAKKALLARTGGLNPADRLLLESLIKEKEAIMTPIQIRVTEPQEGQSKKPKKAASEEEDDDEDEDEEDEEEDEGGTERRAEDEEEEEEEEQQQQQRVKVAPPTMQKVRRRAVFEDDGAMNDLGASFNPASILLALSGGV